MTAPGSLARPVVLALVACASAAVLAAGQQQPRFTERVDVSRVLVDARVVDDHGAPIRGLTPDDFGVKIDGEPAKVETAQWVEGGAVDREGTPLASTRGPVSAGWCRRAG